MIRFLDLLQKVTFALRFVYLSFQYNIIQNYIAGWVTQLDSKIYNKDITAYIIVDKINIIVHYCIELIDFITTYNILFLYT